MFIVFEGIDGSGKTTISNQVTKALRGSGLVVEHLREGGKFGSTVTQNIREFTRDARNLDLVPHAELLLYVARDVQLIDELARPMLRQADIVIADRFLYSPEVLARHGRGLQKEEVDTIIEAAARGLKPDLVFLIDVDPHIARARRRVSKILTRDGRPSSRKGLSGAGMLHRLRAGYRELAARDPQRWITILNDEADLETVVAHIVATVRAARRDGVKAALEHSRDGAISSGGSPPRVSTPGEAMNAFLALIDRRAVNEPQAAAYLLAGVHGDRLDDRRTALAPRAPEVTAYGLQNMDDAVSWQLRNALARWAPHHVLRSLSGPVGTSNEARALRARLAPLAPREAAESVAGMDDADAWTLRDELYAAAADAVVGSLAGLEEARAWTLRSRWLGERGGEPALGIYENARMACKSVAGLDDERAWRLRALARDVAPVAAIASLDTLTCDRAWTWRERYLERAPRVVLGTLRGLDDPRAWEMRGLFAARCKEALDSMVGMDGPAAWRLREGCADVWPSTVVKSLGALAGTARGSALVSRQLERHPGNISLLKHAASIASNATAGVMAA